MVQISGAVVLTVATFSLFCLLRTIFRERKNGERIFDVLETVAVKHQQ